MQIDPKPKPGLLQPWASTLPWKINAPSKQPFEVLYQFSAGLTQMLPHTLEAKQTPLLFADTFKLTIFSMPNKLVLKNN